MPTRRPWLDLHPKILAVALTVGLLLGLVWLAGLVGIDLSEPATLLIVGLLPLIAGYVKAGD